VTLSAINYSFSIPGEVETFKEWIAKQPPEVQETARLFPIGEAFYIRDKTYWTVGYADDGAGIMCIMRDPKTLTEREFKSLAGCADILDPKAIMEIVTRH
jgi:hypothetical protein